MVAVQGTNYYGPPLHTHTHTQCKVRSKATGANCARQTKLGATDRTTDHRNEDEANQLSTTDITNNVYKLGIFV
jgi:hypothetical protein